MPGRLGLVERDVGVAEELARRAAVADGDADARGHRDRRAVQIERLAEHLEQPFGDELGRGSVVVALGEDDELVAAEPPDRLAAPQHGFEPGADRAEELIAGGVAERVVDLLEAVEVDEQHARHTEVAAGARHHLFDAVEHERAVRETGERVVQGLVADLVDQAGVAHRGRRERGEAAEADRDV